MSREIKFRAWDTYNQRMVYAPYLFEAKPDYLDNPEPFRFYEDFHDVEDGVDKLCYIMQFTGLKDKNGVDIYEGDILRWRQAYRSTQTHYGDNIPNGAYTEPMEPEIHTHECEVIYKDYMFGCEVENIHGYATSDDFCPLAWCGNEYSDISEIKEAVSYRHSDDFWDLPKGDGGDLEYLLEQYKCEDESQLLKYASIFEVIGNIYQNKGLL